MITEVAGSWSEDKAKGAINHRDRNAIQLSGGGDLSGVFDYLADLFKFDNSRKGRTRS